MTVISNSGEPSKAATFQIRGTNSINSGTSPLFILDGVPITSADFNAISPNDIESINVLKDASSTSIYGARAANGVVVITTKRGTSTEKVDITFRTQQGFSNLAHGNWNLMNTAERIQFEKEIGLDYGQDYELLEVRGDYALLRNSKGKTGWIHTQMISKTNPNNMEKTMYAQVGGKLLYGRMLRTVAPDWLNLGPMGFCITEDV
jgi:TonB-dependent SusC/RagA subfamily outer membrane receptor